MSDDPAAAREAVLDQLADAVKQYLGEWFDAGARDEKQDVKWERYSRAHDR